MTHDGTNHCQRDTRVATCGLNNGLTRLQGAAVPGVLNDGIGQPVFDRGHRVEGFYLHVHIDVIRRNTVQFNDRCVADGLQNIVVFHDALSEESG